MKASKRRKSGIGDAQSIARPFLSRLDEADAFEAGLADVVSIAPSATTANLVAVASSRLRRHVSLLDELSCISTNETVRLSVFSEGLLASLKEVLNLLDAAEAPAHEGRRNGA